MGRSGGQEDRQNKDGRNKKEMRRPMTDEEIAIARIVAEKEEELNEEEDEMVLRMTEEMVPR